MPKCMTFVAAAAAILLAAACGQRKATEADCQLIVDRLVEVEMRAMNTTDADTILRKQESIRGGMKEEMKDCVGRAVSNRMMDCVKKAESTEKVMACIR